MTIILICPIMKKGSNYLMFCLKKKNDKYNNNEGVQELTVQVTKFCDLE